MSSDACDKYFGQNFKFLELVPFDLWSTNLIPPLQIDLSDFLHSA